MILLLRQTLMGLGCVLLLMCPLVSATQEQMLDPELRALHARGCSAYHGQHDRTEGLRLFVELGALAIQKNNPYWLGSALWKQAQVYGDDGDLSQSILLFERSLAAYKQDDDFSGTANHLMLLGNLFGSYESRGQRGESLRIHREMVTATGLNLARTSTLPANTRLFDLSAEQLRPIKNMAFIGVIYDTEIRLRFECGDDANAIALAEKMDGRFRGTQQPREVTRYAEILSTLAKLYAAAGRTADEEQVLLRLIGLVSVPKSEAYGEILDARIELALLHCRQGIAVAPLFAIVQQAINEAGQRRWNQTRLSGCGKLARLHALTGNVDEAKRLIDTAIEETRRLDEPRLLAELLLARIQIKLDAGELKKVQIDLFEVLKWCRQQGGLRMESMAYVQYVRYLRLSGNIVDARFARGQADTRLSRFPNADQRRLLDAEVVALAATRTVAPVGASGVVEPCDLQPVELTTRIASGWTAQGRFTLTNPGSVPMDGELTATGVALEAVWDAGKLEWRIHASPAGRNIELYLPLVLQPLDQVTVVLSVDPALSKKGEVRLAWRGNADKQSAWWRFSQGPVDSDVAVVDASLALENPFYSVPIHHYIVRMNPDSGASRNLRVVTSVPCRVELVEVASGRVLAVDATGDGDFHGVGDVIYSDGNLDGQPDLYFAKGQRVAALEIQLYPLGRYGEVEVKLELQKRDGSWVLSATDRLMGK